MGTNNFKKAYTWDDSISIQLSNGMDFHIELSNNRDAEYMGYTCTSCGAASTLAFGDCGSCGSPFEPRSDIDEAKGLFPDVKVKIEDADRLAWILQHRNWLCLQCDSYNVNLPRKNAVSHTCSCINCGHLYEKGEDILFEDVHESDEGSTGDLAGDFKNKILSAIEKHKEEKKEKSRRREREVTNTIAPLKEEGHSKNSPHTRNKLRILMGVFGLSGLLYMCYYGFIEKVPYEITVEDHEWSRTQYLEKYQLQKAYGWAKDVTPNAFDDFKILHQEQREAPWDSYEYDTGEDEEVTDFSNCKEYNNPEPICSLPTTTCESAVVNGVKVTGNCTPTQGSCHTPAKTCVEYGKKLIDIMETRYHKHPYIEYSFMDWERIQTLQSQGTGKSPHWEYANNHDKVIEKPKLYRYTGHHETYKLLISYASGGEQKVMLDENNWQSVNVGLNCHLEGTRWGGINSDDLLEVLKNCK